MRREVIAGGGRGGSECGGCLCFGLIVLRALHVSADLKPMGQIVFLNRITACIFYE